MAIIGSVFLCALLLAPRLAWTEMIDFACVHREYRMKLDFRLDNTRKTITHDGVPAREVQIDKTTVSFFLDLTSGEYFHFITRSTGRMTMRAPDGTIVHGFECREQARPSEQHQM
jgi:hypothetical protein